MHQNTHKTKAIGNYSEDLALRYLLGRHHSFVARNYACRSGEIDLVMKDLANNELVFVEVKSSQTQYDPAQNITSTKLKRLARTIEYYLLNNNHLNDFRFDVVTVMGKTGNHVIEWWQDIALNYD